MPLSANTRDSSPARSNEGSGEDGGVFHVGKDVKPPRALYTPEPEYTDVARYVKFQGVVVVNMIVGTDGRVHQARLIRVIGLGLDESALEKLNSWKFDPSTREGRPVAVEMNVEVAFNLY
jgi:TonB family protein